MQQNSVGEIPNQCHKEKLQLTLHCSTNENNKWLYMDFEIIVLHGKMNDHLLLRDTTIKQKSKIFITSVFIQLDLVSYVSSS